MKKFLSMLLIAVMSLSIVACGGKEAETSADVSQPANEEVNTQTETVEQDDSSTTETEVTDVKEVEITLDNWQDYFEFREELLWTYNAFGEAEAFGGPTYFLCLKEEYWDRGISTETNLAFEFNLTDKTVSWTEDLENQQITYGDIMEEEATSKIFSYESNHPYYEMFADKIPQNVIVNLLNGGISVISTGEGNFEYIHVYENIDCTRVQGTLVFEN